MAEIHQERQWRKLPEAEGQNPKGEPFGAMVGPTGPTQQPPGPLLLQVSSRSFLSLPATFPMADKFRLYFALESLFLAFLKFTLENTEYAKLMKIVR